MELLSLLTGLACIGLAWLVIRRSRQSPPLIWSFAVFALGLGLWMIAVALADLSPSFFWLIVWTKLATVVSGTGVASFLIFAYLFRRGPVGRRKIFWLATPMAAALVYVIFFPSEKVYIENPFINMVPGQPVGGTFSDSFALYIPIFFGYIIWSIVILLRRKRSLPSQIKKQINLMASGASVMLFAGMLFDGVLPALGIDHLYSLGPVLAVVWVICAALAIIRHELLDIRVIIQRGVIYSTLVAVITAFYLFMVFGLNHALNYSSELSTLLGGLVTVILGIFGAPALEKYFRRLTDRLFFQNPYNYGRTLHELSAILNNSIEQAEIIERTQALLEQSLRADRVAIVLGNAEAQDGLQIPLMIEGRALGTLVVGSKRSGQAWNSQDLQLLNTFAYQAGIALEKSRLYGQLKKYSENLEQQVEARTKSLQELQEQQRQMMLDIAHNLQTPLTSLQAELSMDDQFKNLERSISEVSKFIYDLLTLARLESQIDKKPFTPCNLSELAAEVLEYVAVLCDQAEIQLTSRIDHDIQVSGNPEELKNLLTNLLSNAVKYRQPNSSARIEVALSQSDGQAVLKITDNGLGISAADLPHIFKRFYRPQSSVDSQTKGSGLGLAICKAIVEKQGGSMSIQSQQDQGTEVKICLPVFYQR